MNFRPKFIKTALAIVIGLISGYYFRDNCINCPVDYLYSEMVIGFVPAFLWVYSFISLMQVNEQRSKFWHYLIVVPFVIIIPLLIGLFLQGYFGL